MKFKSRKLLLIALDWSRPKDPPISLGHASILTNLKRYNIPAMGKSWAVNTANFSPDKVVSYVMSKADINTDIALGAFVWNERAIQTIITSLKEEGFLGKIILGGPQVSYVKEDKELFSYYPKADIFIRGYGEEALAKLYLSDKENPIIPGVTYNGVPGLGLSANVDLEQLPSPFLTGLIPPQRFIRWKTQRGCPFRCSFCQHRESDITMTRRNMPLSRVLEEAKWITDNPVIQDIAVLDPTFNSGPNYLAILDQLIEGKYSGKLALQCRAEMVKNEFLDKVDELNKTGHIVLEFGLQTTNFEEAKLIDRPNNIKKIKSVLEETKDRNIETEISLIFGLPNQTVASFQASVDFCKEMRVSRIYGFPLMLLRGTPLHRDKQKLGLVESNEVFIPEIDRIQEDIPHVVQSPSFDYKEWKRMSEIAKDLSIYNDSITKDSWVDRVMTRKNFENPQKIA